MTDNAPLLRLEERMEHLQTTPLLVAKFKRRLKLYLLTAQVLTGPKKVPRSLSGPIWIMVLVTFYITAYSQIKRLLQKKQKKRKNVTKLGTQL